MCINMFKLCKIDLYYSELTSNFRQLTKRLANDVC